MEHYNVIITPDAAVDLSQLKSYIAYTLQAPETAYGKRLKSSNRFRALLRLFRMNRGIRAESEE